MRRGDDGDEEESINVTEFVIQDGEEIETRGVSHSLWLTRDSIAAPGIAVVQSEDKQQGSGN